MHVIYFSSFASVRLSADLAFPPLYFPCPGFLLTVLSNHSSVYSELNHRMTLSESAILNDVFTYIHEQIHILKLHRAILPLQTATVTFQTLNIMR